jgi:hypothetical protein
MMTLAAAAVVAAMVSQSEPKLVDADTSWPAVPGNMRQPTLDSSEIAAVQYREKPHLIQTGARQFCCLSPASGGSTCVVNSLPAFPSP